MKKWVTTAVIAIGCMMGAHAAGFSFMNGSRLSLLSFSHDRVSSLDKSISADDVNNAYQFSGYILGTTDALLGEGVFCVVNGVTQLQLEAMTSKYLKAHPEQWAMNGSAIVFLALAPLLACKK